MQVRHDNESLNTLGGSELEAARENERAQTDDERRLAHALRIVHGGAPENDVDGAVELARSYAVEQLVVWLAEAREKRAALGARARQLATAMPTTRTAARTSSAPPRVTRRETRSRPAIQRDDGSGGDEPPSQAEVADAMGEELIRSTHAVRVAQGLLAAQRAGVPCLAAPAGVTREEALERARVAFAAQSAAVRTCLAVGVEPKLPPAPARTASAARIVATAADERDLADVVIAIAGRLSPPAALALLTLARHSIVEGGGGVWLSELGLARATRELDEELGADGTAYAFAELSRAGLVWTREEGVRLAVRRAPHPLLRLTARGVHLAKGGAHV